MADLKDFAEKLVNLTVKDVSELTTILKDEYGKHNYIPFINELKKKL